MLTGFCWLSPRIVLHLGSGRGNRVTLVVKVSHKINNFMCQVENKFIFIFVSS